MSPAPPILKGFVLHPDDERDRYVFRIDLSEFGLGTARVVFARDRKKGTTSIHLELMPVTLYKW